MAVYKKPLHKIPACDGCLAWVDIGGVALMSLVLVVHSCDRLERAFPLDRDEDGQLAIP